MGMNLNFSLEDINIEITSDEEVTSSEEQMNNQEQQEAVDDASEEVEAVAKFGMQLADIHQNLSFIKKHVQMFGVTKQMLHLVNVNGQLSSAIGLSLPYYESDDEAEDIAMDDVPEAEVVVENISETLTRWKDNVKKFLKMIWDKLKALGSALLERIIGLEKQLKPLKEKFSKQKINNAKFGTINKVIAFSGSDFIKRWTDISTAITTVGSAKVDYTSVIVGENKIRDGLKYIGKTYSAHEVTDSGEGVKPSEISLSSSWGNKEAFIKAIDLCLEFSKVYKTEKGNIEKVIKSCETAALKSIDEENSDDDSKAIGKAVITKMTSSLIRSYNLLLNEKISMTKMLIGIAKKVPMI